MLLKDLVDRLDVSYREARYALERGHADVWFEQSPGSGNHRELTKAAVYALGLLLLLKKSGFSTPMAQGIVMCIQPYMKGVKIVTRSLKGFDPLSGQFSTNDQWVAEIGDRKAVRIVRDPDDPTKVRKFPWSRIDKPLQFRRGFRPYVTISIDLVLLAQLVESEQT